MHRAACINLTSNYADFPNYYPAFRIVSFSLPEKASIRQNTIGRAT